MRRLAVLLAAAMLAVPATAYGGWSKPVPFPAVRASDDIGAQLAIDARGDALVLWTSRKPARQRATIVRPNGTRTTHTLPAPATSRVVLALDGKGTATAAWTSKGGLYTATASSSGRWSRPQLIAHRHPVEPTLAVARDRRVLLVWTVDSPTGAGGRTGIAWRSPGHRFAHLQLLRHPAPGLMPGEAPQSDNGAAFDARGRAYLWTTCDGVVGITRPHSRTFRLVRLTPGTASLSLAVARSSAGIASWVATRCTGDPMAGTEPGVLNASLLRDGAFRAPTVLTGADGRPLVTARSTAFAPVGAGSLVTLWSENDILQVALDRDGHETAVTPTGTQSMPLVADAAGDLLVSAPYIGVTVRRRDGSEDPFVPGSLETTAATTPDAPGFGVVFDPDLTTLPDRHVTSPATRLSLSFWRP